MDISEVCNLCSKPNDQMLMLKCVHDPCINCAATTYAEQIHIKGQSNQIYVCEICGEQTLLDSTTVQQLSNLANTFVKSPSKYANKRTSQTISTKKYDPLSTQSPSKKVNYYCKDHSQQQVTYYCFTCWQNICPECAIHGNHKEHNVRMIKKAISEVKNDYMEKMGKLTGFQNAVVKGKESFLRIIKSANDRHVREKHIISKEFEAMRTNLTMKEKEFLKELDDVNRHNVQTLTSILQQVNKNYEESSKVKKNIELTMKRDDVLVLEEYKKINQLEDAIRELSKQTQTISGKISALNGDYLVQEVKEVAESVKKIRLKMEEEKIGISQFLDYNSMGSGVKGSHERG